MFRYMFITKNKVRMHDTDMAGILYFPRIYRFAHDALEDFIYHLGLNFHTIFKEGDFIFVIVHSEANYYSSLVVGDDIDVHLSIDHIGTTSFTIRYEIYKKDKSHMGTVRTVHVTIDKVKRTKIEIPEQLRKALQANLTQEDGED